MKKAVRIDKRASRELKKLPVGVNVKFTALFDILREKGKLETPFSKKLQGQNDLFEIRVKYQGQWRAIYAYLLKDVIVILSVFQKKTQKTSVSELTKARNRLQLYLKGGGK